MPKLVTKNIENVIRFIFNYRQFSSELSTDLKPFGVGPDGCLVLFLLYGDNDQTTTKLADRLGLNLPTATKLIDRLVTTSLVHRKPHPTDRRQVRILLTDHGAKMAEQAAEAMEYFVESLKCENPQIAKTIF